MYIRSSRLPKGFLCRVLRIRNYVPLPQVRGYFSRRICTASPAEGVSRETCGNEITQLHVLLYYDMYIVIYVY